MRRPIRLSLTLLVAGLWATQSASAQSTIQVDGGRGPVTVHVPSSYSPEVPMPVVMLLHAYGTTGAIQEGYLQLQPLAEQRGFIYVYPDGTLDQTGSQFWNASNACCDFNQTGVDDSGYLIGLLDLIEAALTVDTNRVFVAGHSNGGFMAYRMACEHADRIAAIASLAGAAYFNSASCTPSEPVDVLQIHGTMDGTISYNGGSIFGQSYPSATGSVERWATYAGCSLVQDTSAPDLDIDFSIPGSETRVTRWQSGCSSGGSGELWTIQGGSHVPNLGAVFRNELVNYLLSHPKPGVGARYCSALPNSSGQPARILGGGSSSVGANDLALSASSVPTGVNGLFFYGPSIQSTPLGAGVLCISAGGVGLFRLPVTNSGAQGIMQTALDVSNPPNPAGQIQPGQTWRFQAWFRDGASGQGQFNFSDALSVEFSL